MNNKEVLKSSFRIMRRYRMRTFFMILGIIIGITALSLTFTIGQAVQNQFLERTRKYISPNSIIIVAQKMKMDAGPHQPNQSNLVSTLTIDDLKAIAKEVPGIKMYDPAIMLQDREVIAGNKNISTVIKGNSANGQFVWGRYVAKGSFFDNADVASASRVAVIGPKLAKTLYGNSDPIGSQFRIGNIPFIVKGVLEPKGVDPHGNDMDLDVIIPITTMMKRVANIDYVNFDKLILNDENQMDQVAASVTALLDKRHHISNSGERDFSVVTPAFVKEMVGKVMRVFNLFLPLISLIALLAAGIVIVVLMLIAINQRVVEIGLRIAVGARRKDILTQFLVEASLTSLSGGITGLLLGLLFFRIVSSFMHLPFYIPWQVIVFGILIPVVVGIVSGIIPARKAAKSDPVEALRG